MVQRKGGFRRKTRKIMRKSIRQKGKISLSRYFQKLEIGQIVTLKAEPAVQKGMYLPRFHGKNGVIVGQAGRCYKVSINDGGKKKLLVVHPVHLKWQV